MTSSALPGGVHAIDTGFHRDHFDASYLLVNDGRAAFIDTGTNHSVPRLLAALADAGLAPEAVDWLIVTHVHLDHAGGAGLLMRSLPKARFVVHPHGARHMIDPTVLYAGALAVYGEAEMQRSYGSLIGIDADRVVRTHDGFQLRLGQRTLEFIDTPGHARHHHCIWDAKTRGFFTGDTFGLSYREFDTRQGAFIFPTTTPVQFEPAAMRNSVQRMLAYQPECMYLTHYGRVGDVPRLGAMLLEQLQRIVELARAAPNGPGRHACLTDGLGRFFIERLRAHGCRMSDERMLDTLAMDIELNAQGLGVWLDREQARQLKGAP